MKAIWRPEIDAASFQPAGHRGRCLVHRLAFRALLDGPADAGRCLAYLAEQSGRFEAAAAAKIARTGIGPEANFHLDSRDIRREP
jgi:hypothetical protein